LFLEPITGEGRSSKATDLALSSKAECRTMGDRGSRKGICQGAVGEIGGGAR
jgi:hypothetical protein